MATTTKNEIPGNGDSRAPIGAAAIDGGSNSDRGKRPSVSKNGEVHGSGAGAGGGNPGEDYDDDPVGGGGKIPGQHRFRTAT